MDCPPGQYSDRGNNCQQGHHKPTRASFFITLNVSIESAGFGLTRI